MKAIKFALMAMAMLVAAPMFQSCLDDDDKDYSLFFPTAMVTVKNIPGTDGIYLQEDAKTTLFPVNLTKSPYDGKVVRAIVNYSDTDGDAHGYTKAVQVHWIDSILTKNTVPTLGTEEDLTKYGNDPVEIRNDWYTVCEDGFLTLRFLTLWGNIGVTHSVNLITGVNPENPYEVHFAHNQFDDRVFLEKDGIVAFDLSALPDTNGETVKLKLTWNSFSGKKSAEFDYCTSKASGNPKAVITKDHAKSIK